MDHYKLGLDKINSGVTVTLVDLAGWVHMDSDPDHHMLVKLTLGQRSGMRPELCLSLTSVTDLSS